MKTEFCQNIFEKYSNAIFHEKSVQWLPISIRTDRLAEMKKLSNFSQFFEQAQNTSTITSVWAKCAFGAALHDISEALGCSFNCLKNKIYVD
jgi:hypothetical protein